MYVGLIYTVSSTYTALYGTSATYSLVAYTQLVLSGLDVWRRLAERAIDIQLNGACCMVSVRPPARQRAFLQYGSLYSLYYFTSTALAGL